MLVKNDPIQKKKLVMNKNVIITFFIRGKQVQKNVQLNIGQNESLK